MGFRVLIAIALGVMGTQAALAQDTAWTGEGAFTAGTSTGNTETTDLGLSLNLARETRNWKSALDAQADFGETDGEESKNRIFLAGQLDRQFSDKAFGFARASHEIDEFSGFESRSFLGGGVGYDLIANQRTTWTLEGGPGLKIDRVSAITQNGMTTPEETLESFSVFGASNIAFQINDSVNLTNGSSLLYAEESTQLSNVVALTAELTGALSARMSFDVRFDTDPPDGFEDTDTTTRFSLVYAFGAGE